MVPGSLIGEWRGVGRVLDFENPARIALDAGSAPGLVVGRRGARWRVPENNARLAFGQIVDYAGLLQRIEGIRSGARSVPNSEDHRISRQARVRWTAALGRVVIGCVGQSDGFVLVVHEVGDGGGIALLPEAPTTQGRWLGLQASAFSRTVKGDAGQARIERAVVALHHHHTVAPAVEPEWLAVRNESARIAGLCIMREDAPAVAQHAILVQKKADGDGAVVDVAIGLHLQPAEYPIVVAQLVFTAQTLDLAMGAVGMQQCLECIVVGHQQRLRLWIAPPRQTG